MTPKVRLTLAEIEQRLCEIAVEVLAVSREQIAPSSSFLEDLGCDSLDMVEFIMAVEERFCVTLPDESPSPIYKTIFTRQPFRVSDLAELVYIYQGTGPPQRQGWWAPAIKPRTVFFNPFTQLDGRWRAEERSQLPLFEPLQGARPLPVYRRRSDGMRCMQLPTASVEIGCDGPDALLDEQPKHVAKLDSFLIDAEPVSTTAYCRFLNSIPAVAQEILKDWFILGPADDRAEHMPVACTDDGWRPLAGTERWPMMLVSWYGANAYSLWANGRDWRIYRDESGKEAECFLPSEAQWEYAARGPRQQPFPWGDAPPSHDLMQYGRHRRSARYRAATLPMADVNEPLGLSPFGLHHMAGNVWQWCRDWYDADFYKRADATATNPANRIATRIRSERGGSWIGPAELCRSSYRRGRPPAARGRCLGFRCVSSVKDI